MNMALGNILLFTLVEITAFYSIVNGGEGVTPGQLRRVCE